MMDQQLWCQPMVEKDKGNRDPGHHVNQAALERYSRIDPLLDPEAEAVKAPGGSPAQERPEEKAIYHPPNSAVAGFIVVSRQEANFVVRRQIFPVAASLADERFGIL